MDSSTRLRIKAKFEIVIGTAFYQEALDAAEAEEINKKDSTDAFAQAALNYIEKGSKNARRNANKRAKFKKERSAKSLQSIIEFYEDQSTPVSIAKPKPKAEAAKVTGGKEEKTSTLSLSIKNKPLAGGSEDNLLEIPMTPGDLDIT